MFAKISKFFTEVSVELRKATWPWDPKERGFKRYRELVDSTVVVFIAMILLGGFVATSDFFLLNFMRLLGGQ